MIVTCPGCASKYRVRNEAVPAEGARMRCPKCETLFLAKPPPGGVSDDSAGFDAPTGQFAPPTGQFAVPGPNGPVSMPPGFGAPGFSAPPGTGGGPPSPFGAFGAPPASSSPPAPSPFGAAPSPFGAAPSPSPFGAAPSPSPFGAAPSPSPFGAAPSPSPFGAAPSAPSPFGAPPSPSPFGAAPSPFGAAPSPSPFGAAPSAPSPFGGPPSPSPFGAPPANPNAAGPLTAMMARFDPSGPPPNSGPPAPAPRGAAPDDDPFARIDLGTGPTPEPPPAPKPAVQSQLVVQVARPTAPPPVSSSPPPKLAKPRSVRSGEPVMPQLASWLFLGVGAAAAAAGIVFAAWTSGAVDLDDTLMPHAERTLGVTPPASFIGADEPPLDDLRRQARTSEEGGDLAAAAVLWQRVIARDATDATAKAALPRVLTGLGERLR